MSIWFPRLPLDRLARRGDGRLAGALAITQVIKNAPRLTHVTEAARQAGARVGQSLADARAICPELLTEPADLEAQTLLLRALWRWSDRLSPWAALDAPDGLFLDISGCAHLFGGEAAMANFAQSELTALNVTTRIGMADTKRAAWALARFSGRDISLALPGATSEAIAELPLKALNIKAATETDLRRTGLSKIGDIQRRKTSDLARRYGLELTQQLSKALGYTPDPVSPEAADPVYAARMTLPDPIGRLTDLTEVLRRLAGSVCTRLEKDQIGARHFDLTVTCVDTGPHVLSAGFARPCQAVDAVLQQFTRPMDDLKIEYGADRFRLIARHLEPLKPRQRILGGEAQQKEEDFGQLISTLGNRLGFDRVRKFLPRDQHIPEGEFTTVEAVQPERAIWENPPRPRPLRLFPRPERIRTLTPGRPPKRFEWRGRAFDNLGSNGPERLAPPWWMAGDRRQRDYWQARTDTGEQLWLMTHPGSDHPDWFVAGCFV
ncbi:MAG: DNA polymerase Y family protein [Hellea sp.]|nr:DNA polymerase Y family protein [Hellea sp.]